MMNYGRLIKANVLKNSSLNFKFKRLHYSDKVKNYYEILEVTPKANTSDIKKAYYRLSKLYHPDQCKEEANGKLFIEITEAYETLLDSSKRELYDASISSSRNNDVFPSYTYRPTDTQHSYQYKTPGRQNIKNFNYDEWIKQHYGELFHNNSRTSYKKTTGNPTFSGRSRQRYQYPPTNKENYYTRRDSAMKSLEYSFALLIGLSITSVFAVLVSD